MNIDEVVIRLIEKEDDYHDRKERMAWIAGALYFTFSAFFIYWLIGRDFQTDRVKIGLTIASVSIWMGTIIFISLQFLSRWQSVDRTNYYINTFRRGNLRSISDTTNLWVHFDHEEENFVDKHGRRKLKRSRMAILILAIPPITIVWGTILFIYGILSSLFRLYEEALYQHQTKSDVIHPKFFRHLFEESRYRTEVPVYAIMTVFLIAQIYLINRIDP